MTRFDYAIERLSVIRDAIERDMFELFCDRPCRTAYRDARGSGRRRPLWQGSAVRVASLRLQSRLAYVKVTLERAEARSTVLQFFEAHARRLESAADRLSLVRRAWQQVLQEQG